MGTGYLKPTLILPSRAEARNLAMSSSDALDTSASVTSTSEEPEYLAILLASMMLPSSRTMLP